MADDDAAAGPSIEDLRKRARELDIAGRSSMDADALAAAIDVAERKRAEADAEIQRQRTRDPREQRFTVAQLRGNRAILDGHSRTQLAAALQDVGASDDDTYTRAEVYALIEQSQNRTPEEA